MLGPIVLAILAAQSFPAFPFVGQATTTQQRPTPTATAEKPWPPAGVLRPGNGVAAPRLVRDVKPSYTPEAMRASIQGVVRMEAVVQVDGTVGEVRVTRSLDREFGQDDECVRTLKKWRFKPGTKDGVAVAVLVEVEMTFTTK